MKPRTSRRIRKSPSEGKPRSSSETTFPAPPLEARTATAVLEEALVPGGADKACLVTIHGADLGKRYDLADGELVLGRGEDAGIRVQEENVSRRHAVLRTMGKAVVVEDLGSRNGTYVNTVRVSSAILKDGDLLLVGNTLLKFMSGSNVESRYHEEIYRMATLDGLTRALNRRFFLERLSEECGRSARYRRDLSLLLLDFDFFKRVNDVHGHPAGDEVLRRSAAVIQRSLRKEDLLGRYGGEELGVLLPETPLAKAAALAEKLRMRVGRERFTAGGRTFQVSISLGAAALGGEVANAEALVKAADGALYLAKQAGRDCVRTA